MRQQFSELESQSGSESVIEGVGESFASRDLDKQHQKVKYLFYQRRIKWEFSFESTDGLMTTITSHHLKNARFVNRAFRFFLVWFGVTIISPSEFKNKISYFILLE